MFMTTQCVACDAFNTDARHRKLYSLLKHQILYGSTATTFYNSLFKWSKAWCTSSTISIRHEMFYALQFEKTDFHLNE